MSLSRRITSAIEAMLMSIEPSSCLAKAEGQTYAHDHLQRALTEKLSWLAKISLYLLTLIDGKTEGYLILDDTIIERTSSGKLKLPKLRNTQGHYCYGLGAVLLIWTKGSIRIPLNVRFYFGDRSKQDLALELLAWAYKKGLKPDYVLFDSWYSSAKILNQIHAYKWSFVTRLKKNRVLAGRQLKRHRGPYWTKVGNCRGLSFELKIIRRGKKFFATNDLQLNDKQIIATYKQRQAIEEVFRGLKQNLGWQGFRYRTRQTVKAHLSLGLVAYALIELARSKLKLSFYKYHRSLISKRNKPPIYLLEGVSRTA